MKIRFIPEARREVNAALSWYLERSEDAAADLADDVDRAVEQIKARPLAWPAFHRKTRRYILDRFPYQLVYRILEEEIVVYAFASTHRRAVYWRGRL